MNAIPYSDDINKGFEIVKKHLKDIGLWNRIYSRYEIDSLAEHHLFQNHYGGVEFDVKIKMLIQDGTLFTHIKIYSMYLQKQKTVIKSFGI